MSGEGLIAEPRAVHPTAGHARLKELMHRGTEFLGCDVAIMGGNTLYWQIRYADGNRRELVEYRSASDDPDPNAQPPIHPRR